LVRLGGWIRRSRLRVVRSSGGYSKARRRSSARSVFSQENSFRPKCP
jgi:hypothetical protein